MVCWTAGTWLSGLVMLDLVFGAPRRASDGLHCFALQPAGISPRQATYFSLLRQREVGKRKATPIPAPLACGDRFPAVLEDQGEARNSLRSLRSLRSDSRAKSDHEARCARRPGLLRSSALHRGPRTANSRIPNSPRRHILRAVSRLLAVGCLGPPCSCREAQGPGASARSARSTSGSARMFERREQSERSEFGPPAPGTEHRRGPLGAAKGQRSGGRLSLPTFFGEAKKVGRLPGRHPGGVHRTEDTPPQGDSN